MTGLTTHVLDAATGDPAGGITVVLAQAPPEPGAAGKELARGTTDGDGRLAVVDALEAGTYALTFATGPYFAARRIPSFHPYVTVAFTVTDAGRHHHVPLLLSPFAYSTYRGS